MTNVEVNISFDNSTTPDSPQSGNLSHELPHEQLAEISELYRTSYPKMLAVARKYQFNDPEVTVQTAWEKALKHWDSYTEQGYTRETWLARIVKNTALDLWRRHNRIQIDPSSDMYAYESVSTNERVEDSVTLLPQIMGRVATLLADKPDHWYEIYERRALYEEKYDDIAQKMGISPGTVKSTFNRVKTLLAEDDELYDLLKQ